MIRLIEYLITRRRLHSAHTNATGAPRGERAPEWTDTRGNGSVASTGHTGRSTKPLNTVQGTSHTIDIENQPHTTSPTNTPETEPHQPRVGAGKSPVDVRKLGA